MLDPKTFTVDDPRFSTQRVIGPSMLSLDGDDHRRHRDPFAPPFRAVRIQGIEAAARQTAQRLVEGFGERGAGDLRALVAAPLAVSLMTELLDLEDVAVDDVVVWYRDIVDAVHAVTEGGEVPDAGLEAFSRLGEAVAAGSGDSELLSPIVGAGDLTTEEVVSNVAVLLFGGIVTAESAIAIAFRFLLEDPQLMRVISARRSLIEPFVEETLRLEPSAAVVDRYATRDVRIGGASIAAGDLVRVSLSGANRDPEVFVDPDRVDLNRTDSRKNLTFARGPHACLGVHLARMETVVAVEALLDAVPGIAPGRLDPIEGLIFRAPATVRAAVS
jgi:cytochrome P450